MLVEAAATAAATGESCGRREPREILVFWVAAVAAASDRP